MSQRASFQSLSSGSRASQVALREAQKATFRVSKGAKAQGAEGNRPKITQRKHKNIPKGNPKRTSLEIYRLERYQLLAEWLNRPYFHKNFQKGIHGVTRSFFIPSDGRSIAFNSYKYITTFITRKGRFGFILFLF